MYFAFGHSEPHIWMVWFALFGLEALSIMYLSALSPGLDFEETHLNVRMALLTLIIMGEGVILLARTVNKMVGGGGWTKWSFIHILGVTSTVVSSPSPSPTNYMNVLTHSYRSVSLVAIISRYFTQRKTRKIIPTDMGSATFSTTRYAHSCF
jgi:hypothetical protein